ncbi:MAG TPA: hypothetical protein VHY35_14380 [Stellaceae bacterium]|jgi:hypothetical protein|nr:hypothetical protein [Stellaceae bacterium]
MNDAMSRCDRLERWAAVLERTDRDRLSPFRDVELLPKEARADLRVANSPLALACEDPALRQAGLGSDRFGDGAVFFGLSRNQAHRVLCSCGYMGTMQPTEVARRLRRLAARERLRRSWTANPLPAFARWLTESYSLAG